MIAIIDYGLGNIKAFCNIYHKLNIQFCIARSAEDLTTASKIILPGVGAFDHAMFALNNSGMRELLDKLVLEKGVPVLGICVGMQMMANSSAEGKADGLGWVPGEVKRFTQISKKLSKQYPLPHMGWNDISIDHYDPIVHDLDSIPRFYFLHSYYFECREPENSIATSEYIKRYTCVVKRNNIYGVQFHPEKSHHYGVSLLKNFGTLENVTS